MTVLKSIHSGLAFAKLGLEENSVIVEGLLAKLSMLNEDRQNEGYAFIMARNFAFDALRSAVRSAKARAKDMLDSKRQAELEEEERQFQAAHLELKRIIEELSESKLRGNQRHQLRIVRLWVFERYSTEMLAGAYPSTSDNQRQQWKTRGIKLLTRHASENLLLWLNLSRYRHKKSDPCSFNLLTRIA